MGWGGYSPPRLVPSEGSQYAEGAVFWRTREVDGETVLTTFGRILALILMPFIAAWIVIRKIFPRPFDYLENQQRVRGEVIRDRKYQRRFFRKCGLDPQRFWLTDIDYKTAQIPKKTGGHRTLQIPSPELKLLQKKLKRFLEANLQKKVHKCANAYVHGRNTITNARPHLGAAVVIKMDITDFFGSVTREHLSPFILGATASKGIAERVLEICLTSEGLPQGAPTSPLLSNLCLKTFDLQMYAACNRLQARYTRYSDDITVSLASDNPKMVRSLIKLTQILLKENGFELNLKKRKLRVLRGHQAQRICGITINSGKPTISRKQRRLLRSAEYRLASGAQSSLTQSQLAGWRAYIDMVATSQPY